MNDKWDRRFLDLAHHVSLWSKDPSTKVGCVLVDPRRVVIGIGYNGFPRGVNDSDERLADRAVKYQMVQHAEANAVLNASASARGATAFVTHPPCANCAGLLIQAGIARIVTTAPGEGLAERFKDSFASARIMCTEAGLDYLEL